jgi:hypothetical protein
MNARTQDPPHDDDEWRLQVPGRTMLEPVDPEEAEELTVGEKLRAALAGTPSDRVVVKVYRTNPATRKLEWLDDYPAQEFMDGDLGMVRRLHGAGSYEFRVTGTKGTLGRMRQVIGEAPQPPAPPPIAPLQSSEFADVMRTLAEGQNRILQALAERPAQSDPMEQMRRTVELLALMRQLNPPPAPAPAPSSLGEVVQAMRELRAVSEEINPPQKDSDNPMSMLGDVMELVKLGMQQQGAAPGGAPGTPGTLPPLMLPQSLAEAPQRQAAPVLATIPAPAPVSATVAPITPITPLPATPTHPDDPMNPLQVMILKGALSKLLDMAARGASTEDGATYIADEMPDTLLPYLDLPNWWDILKAVAPEVVPHETWFKVAKGRADELLDGADDEDTPEPQTGAAAPAKSA